MSPSTSSSRKQRMGWASSSSAFYHHLEDNNNMSDNAANLSISPSSSGSVSGIHNSVKSPSSKRGGMKQTRRLLRMFILPTLAVSVVYIQIHSLGFVMMGEGELQQELDHMAH